MTDMMEALEWAAGYAERTKLFDPVTNARGYADGWKPPTPEEKRAIIAKLAESVVSKPGTLPTFELNDIAMLCAHGAILCAKCEFIPDSWKALSRG